MYLRITGDVNQESGVAEVIYEISGPTENYFAAKDYGAGLRGVGVVLVCRDPELNFKRRVQFSKKNKTLYMDIMLNLEEMSQSKHERRKQIILERLAEEIPAVLSKYSIRDFDKAQFVKDLKSWIEEASLSKITFRSGRKGLRFA
jgi:hypothetical protein